jgi:ribonuclease BN (tRNA processing enzyme)
MKIQVFQSDEGDCLLLTGADGKRILCDGGMANAFRQFVAPNIAKIPKKEKIDIVYLSHIDSDHISGILEMMNNAVEWKVHEYQVNNIDANHKPPKVPRPPAVGGIWHNAFHELTQDNTGEIEGMLAASALVLSGSSLPDLRATAAMNQNLATSVKEAINLTRRVGDGQLDIPVNKPAGGKLMLVRETRKAITLGGFKLYIIGPFTEDLEKLRKDWNKWLDANKKALKSIRTQSERTERELGMNEVDELLGPLFAQAKKFGDRTAVTPPNLASLMFYLEEKKTGRTILLTGDGHADDVIKGLGHNKKLDKNGKLHVDVLKVQHHGSEYNMTKPFAESVTADHYIWCGNGGDENPDLETLEVVVDARLADGTKRAFKFWFNSHSSVAAGKKGSPAHMKLVEKLVQKSVTRSKGRLKVQYLKSDSFTLTLA